MSEAIKVSDIWEGGKDPFIDVKKTLDESLKSLQAYNEEMRQTGKVAKTVIDATKNTSSGLTKLIELEKKMNTNVKEAEKTKKEQIRLEKELEKVRLAEIKLQQDREKAFDRFEAAQQRAAKQAEAAARKQQIENEKLAKQAAREKKLNDDKNNAYKQLAANTNKLKDESKRLGAELIKLEQAGHKNTKAYRDLEAQYRGVTQAAQRGQAQLVRLDATVGDNQRKVGMYERALNGLKGTLGTLGLAFGATMVVGKVRSLITESIDLTRIQEKAVAQVAAGLASTGNIVGFTLDELKAKASALQKETLFGDETILTDLTSVLLTFTNITGDAFDRAQQAALDLSTRMGGDLKGAAVQLGKALNDPIKGVTALRKSGVSFTKEQQEMIKTLTKSGQIMEAQNIILNEMSRQFGGSAKAAAEADGGIEQLQNAVGDAKEEFGKIVLEGLKPTIQSLKTFFENLKPEEIKSFVSTLGTVLKVIGRIVTSFVAYKAITIAVTAKNALMGRSFKDVISSLFKLGTTAQTTGTNVTGAATSVSRLGAAFKAIAWVALISAIIEVAKGFYDIASGAKAARERVEAFDKAKKKSQEESEEHTESIKKRITQEIEELSRRNKMQEAAAKNDKERLEIQKQFAKDKENITRIEKEALKREMEQKQRERKAAKEDMDRLRSITKLSERSAEAARLSAQMGLSKKTGIGRSRNLNPEEMLTVLGAKYREADEAAKIYSKTLSELNTMHADSAVDVELAGIEIENNSKKITAKIPKMQQLNTEFETQNEYLSRQAELLREIAKIDADLDILRLERQIDEIMNFDETTILDVQKLVDEITEIKRKGIEEQIEYEISKVEEKAALELQKEIDAVEKKRTELLAQKELTKAAELEIENNYQKELDAIAEREKARAQDVAIEKELIERKRVQALEQLENDKVDKLNALNDELAANQNKILDDTVKKIEDTSKAIVNAINEAQKGIINAMQNSMDRKIDMAKREEDIETQKINHLYKMAEMGAILDDQSIAAAEERREKAQRRQMELEERKQRLEMISLALTNIGNVLNSGGGAGEALSSTASLQAAITAMFASFKGFEKGTDNAPRGLAFVDEAGAEIHTDKHGNIKSLGHDGGARLQWLDAGDKIIPHQKSMAILQQGSLKLGERIQTNTNERLMHSINQKLDKVVSAIQNQPQQIIGLEETLAGMVTLTTATRKGSHTKISRYHD
jgi:DNA repair exonuclease SbcCD ATPase subunit